MTHAFAYLLHVTEIAFAIALVIVTLVLTTPVGLAVFGFFLLVWLVGALTKP